MSMASLYPVGLCWAIWISGLVKTGCQFGKKDKAPRAVYLLTENLNFVSECFARGHFKAHS